MGAKRTDFGTEIEFLLPYPCSRKAWASLGSNLTTATLHELGPHVQGFKLKLPSASGTNQAKMETILCIVGELWVNTTIGIVKDEGFESERAMMCFVTLHFMLLCLAEDYPGLQAHAARTVKEFLKLID